jgi:NAD(P)-dependent dehydrogenase (short-subunit alcohol dehydrogenase family)
MLAHVYVARHLVPRMVQRGHGHVMITASVAGLVNRPHTAAYTATRHGSVAIAEWLGITHGGDTGVSFSCLCPGFVRTPMTVGVEGDAASVASGGGLMEPEEAADAIVTAMTGGDFLILTHPQFAEYERFRTVERDRWLRGMRRAWRKVQSAERA